MSPLRVSRRLALPKTSLITSYSDIKRVMPRASASQISDLAGSSATSKGDRIHSKADHRVSAVSAVSSSGAPARDKEHAVCRTMRSLEGTRRIPDKPKKDVRDSKDRDVLGAIKRPAPSPPRPQSLDSSLQQDRKTNKAEQRRSLGADKHLAEVTEESPIKAVPAPGEWSILDDDSIKADFPERVDSQEAEVASWEDTSKTAIGPFSSSSQDGDTPYSRCGRYHGSTAVLRSCGKSHGRAARTHHEYGQ